jgi:hypothetical protein
MAMNQRMLNIFAFVLETQSAATYQRIGVDDPAVGEDAEARKGGLLASPRY